MFINKNHQKITILIIVLLSFNGFIAYGESMFTDISNSHWAYDYVEKVVDLGLMDGYEDGTFRPNDEVNTADALVYVTRLFNTPSEEIEKMRGKYSILLNKFELSEERKDALAIALSKGLVTEIFVENNLFVKGKIRTATKVELSIYIAEALGIEEKDGEVFLFLYKDTDSIPERARPYIKFLIDKGILEAKGDGNGNFNPDQPVIRSVLAKILYLSYGKMDGSSIVTIPEEPVEEPEKSPIKTPVEEPVTHEKDQLAGIITGKVDKFIFIDNGQRVDSYTFDKDASIIIDNYSGFVDDLESGMNIKATISEGNIIKSLTVDSNKEILTGIINNISLGTSSSMVVELDEGGTKTFHISKETEILLNGRESYFYSLKEGDRVKVESFDDLALFISGESRNGKVRGMIKDRHFYEEYMILVEREDKTTYEYILDENLMVYRNSNGVNVKKLRPGDQVVLTLSNGEVESIEAKSTPGEDEGYIKKILISEEPKLTILNSKEEMVDYYISPKSIIKIGKEIKSIYDIRLDYFAKLKLESDEIVNVEIEKQDRD